jgi:hypothetical protein
MSEQPRRYRAYLLRLWRTDDNREARWRASLEEPHTGLRHGFATLAELFTFLEEQTERDIQPGSPPNNIS